jgi:AsmA protein
MNKIVKWGLLGLGALFLLVVVAVAIFAMTFDPNRYKPEIERLAKEQTGRTLKLKGDLAVAIYPSLGAKVAGVTLSERASESEFLSIENAHASVALLPLLHGQVIVDRIRVSGLKAEIVKQKDGRFNFSDLLEGKPGEAGKPAPQKKAPEPAQGGAKGPVAFDVAGVEIDHSALNYRDLGSGQELALSDLKLTTGRISERAEGKLTLHAAAKGRNPQVDLKLDFSSEYKIDLPAQSYSIAKLDAKLAGAAAGITGIDLKLTAPRVAIAKDKAQGEAVSAELKMKQGTNAIEAKLHLAGVEGSAKALVIPQLSAELEVAGPDLPMKRFKIPLNGSLRADLEKQTLNADLTSKFDDTSLQAKLGLAKFSPPSYVFDINIDKLNLDRYLPPEKNEVATAQPGAGKSAPAPGKEADTPLDLSALKDLNANGRLQVGALQARGLKLANLKTEVRAAGGRLEAPHSASLYEGTVSGTAGLWAEGRIALKDSLNGIAIGPLLHDVAQQDRLEGRGNVVLDVNAAGKSVNAMKRSLGGTARVNLKDGAIKGIDIAAILRKAKSALGGGQSAQAAASTEKTDFSEFSASFVIRNGVAHNEDLDVKAPLFRVAGRGDIDIGSSSLDYTTRASVVASAKGQGGDELSQLAGLTVPVHLSGPFDAMKYQVDYGAAAAGLAKSKAAQKLEERLGDKLKGLLKR